LFGNPDFCHTEILSLPCVIIFPVKFKLKLYKIDSGFFREYLEAKVLKVYPILEIIASAFFYPGKFELTLKM
tara:strand:+ start:786 stop:1001 length:216 start_codon:yes stop_codon:yes gene_type:complete